MGFRQLVQEILRKRYLNRKEGGYIVALTVEASGPGQDVIMNAEANTTLCVLNSPGIQVGAYRLSCDMPGRCDKGGAIMILRSLSRGCVWSSCVGFEAAISLIGIIATRFKTLEDGVLPTHRAAYLMLIS